MPVVLHVLGALLVSLGALRLGARAGAASERTIYRSLVIIGVALLVVPRLARVDSPVPIYWIVGLSVGMLLNQTLPRSGGAGDEA